MIRLFRRSPKVAAEAPAPKPLQETAIDIGGRLVPLRLRVNRRARRLIVRVDPAGRILVTTPSKRAAPEAIAFARSRALWIKMQLDTMGPLPFRDGMSIPYRGRPHRLVHRPGARGLWVEVENGAPVLIAGGEALHLNRRVVDWLKREAKIAITASVEKHVEKLGVARGRIVIRDPSSRWGSCTSAGGLSFSWRLILAPPEILDYVAAHECAHLIHMNHSPRFWRLVASLGVDAAAARAWFAEHGPALHRFGRTAAV